LLPYALEFGLLGVLISCHQNHIQVDDDLEEQVLERKLSCTTICLHQYKIAAAAAAAWGGCEISLKMTH
jgi:hypothetical protein